MRRARYYPTPLNRGPESQCSHLSWYVSLPQLVLFTQANLSCPCNRAKQLTMTRYAGWSSPRMLSSRVVNQVSYHDFFSWHLGRVSNTDSNQKAMSGLGTDRLIRLYHSSWTRCPSRRRASWREPTCYIVQYIFPIVVERNVLAGGRTWLDANSPWLYICLVSFSLTCSVFPCQTRAVCDWCSSCVCGRNM